MALEFIDKNDEPQMVLDKINNAITEVETPTLKFTDWSTEGIVLQNGARWYSSNIENYGYSIADLGDGHKIVSLNIVFKGIKETGVTFAIIPKSIAPRNNIGMASAGSANGFTSWDISKDGGISAHGTSYKIETWNNENEWLPIAVTYLI